MRCLLLSLFIAALALSAPARIEAQAAQTQAAPQVPLPVAILAMVRTTLLALDHANRTGNYTVLRDLAGPQFHDANTSARLAQMFGALPSQGVDLLPVAISEPVFTQAPSITAEGRLRIVGRFEIAPRPINFDIAYEPVAGAWRIFQLNVTPG